MLYERWRIEMLGGLRVLRDSQVIERFRTQRAAALLAFLAYFPDKEHSREMLIDMLWPEAPPEAGAARLRQELASLRRQIEPPGVPAGSVFSGRRLCVRLNSTAVVTDAAQF